MCIFVKHAFIFISSYIENYENNKYGKICRYVMLINLHNISTFSSFYSSSLCIYVHNTFICIHSLFAIFPAIVFSCLEIVLMLLLLVTSRTFVVVFFVRKLSFFSFICKTHCNRVPETTNFQRVLNYPLVKVFVLSLKKSWMSALT